LKKKLN